MKYTSITNLPTLFLSIPSFIIFLLEILFIIIHLQKHHQLFTSCSTWKASFITEEEMYTLQLSRSDSDTSHTSFV